MFFLLSIYKIVLILKMLLNVVISTYYIILLGEYAYGDEEVDNE